MITLTTYAEAKEAFRSRSLRQALYDEGARLMSGVIVNLHGDEHIARRRLENRLFSPETFACYERDRIPMIIDDVLRQAVADGHGELLLLAQRTMTTLSVDVAGIDRVTGIDDELRRFFEIMSCLARASTVVHTTGDKQAIIDAGDRALTGFESEFFEPSKARRIDLLERVRRGELDEAALPRDVLTTLLRNQDRLDLPAETLLREVAYFPWVGAHSTAAQLVHALHHMFEWMDVHPADGAALIGNDVMRQRFVHESMRLHPASPVALRIATTDIELRSGRVLPAGATVVISVHDANRDSAVFGVRADAFDPYREYPDGVAPWGLSFGHGSHACLGRELAGGVEAVGVAAVGVAAGGEHLFGSVALMAGELLRRGARPDPEDPATLDSNTTRIVWGRYPVTFDQRR